MVRSITKPPEQDGRPQAPSRKVQAFRWFQITGRALLAVVVMYLLVVLFLPLMGSRQPATASRSSSGGSLATGTEPAGEVATGNSPDSGLPALLFTQPGKWVFDKKGASVGIATATTGNVAAALTRLPTAVDLTTPIPEDPHQHILMSALTADAKNITVARSGVWETTLMRRGGMQMAVLSRRATARSSPADTAPDGAVQIVELRVAVPEDTGSYRILSLPMCSPQASSLEEPLSNFTAMPLLPETKVLGNRVAGHTPVASIYSSTQPPEDVLQHWRSSGWICSLDQQAHSPGKLYRCTRTGKDDPRYVVSFLPAPSGSLYIITAY